MNIKNNKKQANADFLRESDEAVAGIIVAVMIVGLVIAVISLIQTVYIPRWMEEREAAHMMQVNDQFAQLKYMLDTLAATHQSTPMSTSITLGSKELGFLSSARAFGHLQVYPDDWYLVVSASGPQYEFYCSTLKYSSENAYYINQNYIYETGAMVLEQSDGSVFIASPSISASLDTTSTPRVLTISIDMVNLNVSTGKISIGGYGTYPIQARFIRVRNPNLQPINNVDKLEITTKYPKLWMDFLDTVLSDAGLTKEQQQPPDPGEYKITSNNNLVTVEFGVDPAAFVINLEYQMTDIDLQLAPGWVKK
ncbi:MAG: hypothetical protein QXS02_01325 [Candidatus Thermoplasmatota archaeon]